MEIKLSLAKSRILVISDMHLPYEHPDAFKFLTRIRDKYKFTHFVSVGDLGDFHNISFHKSDPNLPNAGGELTRLRAKAAELQKLFPKMIITMGNHDSLPSRKMFDAGMPNALLKPMCDIYGVKETWQFVDELTVKDGNDIVYFVHGISKNGLRLATQRGVHVVQGHYHTEFRIDYASNPRNLLWSMQVGCLIDRKALAFAYDKLNLNRPIIGCGMIEKGQPKLLPMVLDTKHRWTGFVP